MSIVYTTSPYLKFIPSSATALQLTIVYFVLGIASSGKSHSCVGEWSTGQSPTETKKKKQKEMAYKLVDGVDLGLGPKSKLLAS